MYLRFQTGWRKESTPGLEGIVVVGSEKYSWCLCSFILLLLLYLCVDTKKLLRWRLGLRTRSSNIKIRVLRVSTLCVVWAPERTSQHLKVIGYQRVPQSTRLQRVPNSVKFKVLDYREYPLPCTSKYSITESTKFRESQSTRLQRLPNSVNLKVIEYQRLLNSVTPESNRVPESTKFRNPESNRVPPRTLPSSSVVKTLRKSVGCYRPY